MANSITKNKKIILRCANWLLDFLYEKLLILLDQQKIDNQNLHQLIQSFDQEIAGYGFVNVDIGDYLKGEEEFILFSKMVKQIVDQAVEDKFFEHELEKRMRQFQQKIAG